MRSPQRDDYEHLLVLREDIGEVCRVCGLVKTHIENRCFKNRTGPLDQIDSIVEQPPFGLVISSKPPSIRTND